MRIIITISFILLIIVGSFKDAAIIISFKLNQSYIAKNLCVERDVENSTCGGCCQLNKKLEEQHQEQNTANPERKISLSLDQYCHIIWQFNAIAENPTTHYKLFKLLAYNRLFVNKPFHPPKA